MKNKPIIEVSIEKLTPAPWNPKQPGSEEETAELLESIKHDGSYGVPAVRKVKGGLYEVIDGNHRLDALLQAGIKTVRCEDFGRMSKKDAILLSHRRNHQWFQEDQLLFANLLASDVTDGSDLSSLAQIMPESEEDLANLLAISEGNWEFDPGKEPEPKPTSDALVFHPDEATKENWNIWKTRAIEDGAENDEEAFAMLLIKAGEF